MNVKALITISLIIGAIFAVWGYMSTAMPNNPTIIYLTSSTFGVALFALIRNLGGFIENKLDAEDPNQVQYQLKMFGATISRFTVYIPVLNAAIMAILSVTPYVSAAIYITGAISVVFDFLITKLGK